MILLLDLVLGVTVPWVEEIHDPRPTYVDPRYADHLTQLAQIHLVETQEDLRSRKRTRREVRCWSGYFAVPKTEETSRAIFSGGRVSKLCPSPPNENLMTQPEVLWHVHDMLGSTTGPLYFVEADLRHWFYQITAHETLRMLFGLQMKPPSTREKILVFDVSAGKRFAFMNSCRYRSSRRTLAVYCEVALRMSLASRSS
jgi:hypothetical protein